MPPVQQVTSTVTNLIDNDLYRITTSRDGYFIEFEDYQTTVGAIIGSGEPILKIDNSGITIPPSGTFELPPTATIETTGADGSSYRIQTYLTNENRDLSQNKATLIQRLDGSSSITQQTLVQTNPDGRIAQISSIGTDGRIALFSPTNSADPTVVDTGLTDINAIVARQMPGAIPPSPALSTPVTTSQQPDTSTVIYDSGSGEGPDGSSIDPTTTPRAITVDPTTDRSTPILSTPDGSTPGVNESTPILSTPDGSTPGVNESTPILSTPGVNESTTTTTIASDGSGEEEFFDAQEYLDELDACPPGTDLDYQVTPPEDLDALDSSNVFDDQPPEFPTLLGEEVPRQPGVDRSTQLGQAALGFLTVLQTAAVGIAGIANTTCKFAIEAANATIPLIGNATTSASPLIGNTTTAAPDALEENSQAGLSTSDIVGIGAAVTLVASVAAYKVQQMRKESRKIKIMNSVESIGDPQARVLQYLDGPPPSKIAWPETSALTQDGRNINEPRESFL